LWTKETVDRNKRTDISVCIFPHCRSIDRRNPEILTTDFVIELSIHHVDNVKQKLELASLMSLKGSANGIGDAT
jgi:hypothetical protein